MTMNIKPTYRVATAGLDERDVRLIDIVFRHSQYNAVSYTLAPVTADGQVDILIINPFEADGLRTLSRVRARGQSTPLITAVPVGMKSPSRHAIHIERLTLQLLPVLNQLVEADFGSPAPQVFRMTDSAGRRVERTTLGQRLERSPATVVTTRSDDDDSLATPSTLSAETIVATTVVDTTAMPASGFAGSTVITTLSPESGYAPSVRAVPQPPMSILADNPGADNRGQRSAFDLPSRTMAKRLPDAATPLPVTAAETPPTDFSDASDVPDIVRVLVVDDSPTVRKQMQQALKRMGVECIAVADGKAALSELERYQFAMALVDVVMGDIDGYQLTREIRRRVPGVPVVILTSRSSPFDLARGALSGCSSYLVKPVPLKRLQSVVLRCLRKSRRAAEKSARRLRRSDDAGNAQQVVSPSN